MSCFWTYILQKKLNNSDLSVCSGPHQRSETFLVLEVDGGFCGINRKTMALRFLTFKNTYLQTTDFCFIRPLEIKLYGIKNKAVWIFFVWLQQKKVNTADLVWIESQVRMSGTEWLYRCKRTLFYPAGQKHHFSLSCKLMDGQRWKKRIIHMGNDTTRTWAFMFALWRAEPSRRSYNEPTGAWRKPRSHDACWSGWWTAWSGRNVWWWMGCRRGAPGYPVMVKSGCYTQLKENTRFVLKIRLHCCAQRDKVHRSELTFK